MQRALGNDLILGRTREEQEVPFPREARSTHLYCCGGTGTGKSKFLVRLVESRTPVSIQTPTVTETPASEERITNYTNKQLERWPFALPKAEANRLLKERENSLETNLMEAEMVEPKRTKRSFK